MVDILLDMMKEEHPNYPLDALLSWACLTKNSIHPHHGYTPNQLIYSMDPNLTEGLSAGEDKAPVEKLRTLATTTNSLRTTRETYTTNGEL